MSEIRSHVRLPFRFSAGRLPGRFGEGLRRGEINGNRCPVCSTLYVPPHAFCSRCWEPCAGWERVRDEGAVVTFVVVNVPFHGQQVDIPYVLAQIRLDGADSTILHLVGRRSGRRLAAPADLAAGTRVRAVWREAPERFGSLNDDVAYFEPLEG